MVERAPMSRVRLPPPDVVQIGAVSRQNHACESSAVASWAAHSANAGDAGMDAIAEHRQFVVGMARGMGRGRIDPDDLAQDVLERWLRSSSRHPPVNNPRAWLVVVLRRLVIDRLRRQRASPEISIDCATVAAEERAAAPWWTDLDAKAIEHELSHLPPALRETFELFTFEAKSYREIATQLKIAMGTVGVRISRARALLKRRFTERGLASSAEIERNSDREQGRSGGSDRCGNRDSYLGGDMDGDQGRDRNDNPPRRTSRSGAPPDRGDVRMIARGSGCSAARELACR